MVIYTKEEKTLIIPEGLGTGTGSCEGVYREGYNDGYQSGTTDGYREGYEDGVAADCGEAIAEAYESGITYQKSLLSSTTITENGVYTNENGWSSVEVDVTNPIIWVEKRFSLESGDTSPWTVLPDHTTYMTEVIVTDNGYGQAKYDSGYTAGLNDCDCSESYQLGYTSGYTDGRESVTSGCPMQEKFVSISSVEQSVTPDYGYAGLSEVHINAQNYYNTAYNDGYSAGQADCPECSGGTCNIENDQTILLSSDWTGETVVEHSEGYDGMMGVTVQDGGYGQAKYESGYTVGYDEGYDSGSTDGYQTGYDEGYLAGASTTDCSSAITEAYQSGYTEGYGAGYITGSADGYNAGEQYGFQTGYQSGYTDGYNDAITANCGSAITEAYESGVTEERGNIYAVKIKVTPTSQNWSWTQYGTPHKLTAADALGNNYVFNINYVIYDGYSWDEDAGQTYIDYEFLGRFETTGGTPVKYLTPAQLTIEVPSQDYNTWGSNIGIEVFFNGEMIPAQYEGNPIPPLVFDLENGFKYEAVSYSVGYNAEDSRCYQLIIDLQ